MGKRQDVIATPWQALTFSGLAPGQGYTLTIELEAGQNESLASWFYVDGVNEAPVAEINFNPGKTGAAVEGDFVVFDCLQSVDPEGSDFSCIWTADFPGVPSGPLIGTTVIYSFPDDGQGTMNLEVTDGEASTSASASITIQDSPALVNALNVEVLPPRKPSARCRRPPGSRLRLTRS